MQLFNTERSLGLQGYEIEKLCVLRTVFISSVSGGMRSRGMRKVAELNRSMKTYIIICCVST